MMILNSYQFAPSGPLLPSDLSNLVRWYKADSFALADGTPIGGGGNTWIDQSASGVNAAQATAGNRPVFKTNIVNGKPVIRFTSASQHYLTHTTLTLIGHFTIIVISSSTNDHCVWGHDAANEQVRIGDAGTNILSFFPASNQVQSNGLTNAQNTFRCMTWRRSDPASTIVFRENKTLVTSAGSSVLNLVTNLIGCTFTGALDLFANADIAELCVYSTIDHTDANLDSLYDNYFKPKYGLP